jgi:HEAT repeat protein
VEIRDLRDRYVAGLKRGKGGTVAESKTAAERHERTIAATVRAQSAYQLGMLGPIAEEVVEPLREALKDPEPYVRLCAIDALGRLGAPALPAVPDLEAAGKATNDDREKQSIAKAIAAIKFAEPVSSKATREQIEAIHRLKASRS